MGHRDLRVGWDSTREAGRTAILCNVLACRSPPLFGVAICWPELWREKVLERVEIHEIRTFAQMCIQEVLGLESGPCAIQPTFTGEGGWRAWFVDFAFSVRGRPREWARQLWLEAVLSTPDAACALIEADPEIGRCGLLDAVRERGRSQMRQESGDRFFHSYEFLLAFMVEVFTRGQGLELSQGALFEHAVLAKDVPLSWRDSGYADCPMHPTMELDSNSMNAWLVSVGCLTRTAATVFSKVINPRARPFILSRTAVAPFLRARYTNFLSFPRVVGEPVLHPGPGDIVVSTREALEATSSERRYRRLRLDAVVAPTTVELTVILPVRPPAPGGGYHQKRITWVEVTVLSRSSTATLARELMARKCVVVACRGAELDCPPERKAPLPSFWKVRVIDVVCQALVLRRRSPGAPVWDRRVKEFAHPNLSDCTIPFVHAEADD